jgi:hypothetical protein
MRKKVLPDTRAPLSTHQIKAGDYLRLDLQAAHEILPIVQKITRRAVEDLEPFGQRLNNMVPADPRNAQVKLDYERVVKNWAGKIERLGLNVLGLWKVGFDGGEGWYGWQYPERRIRFFLEYDALFSDRCLLGRLHEAGMPVRMIHK